MGIDDAENWYSGLSDAISDNLLKTGESSSSSVPF
jgi:hypothetical protein